MSDATLDQFSCDACARTYAWKPQLAGKKVKCKCGTPIKVPEALKPENTDRPADDGFGDLDLDSLARADARAVDRTANHASDLRIIPMAAPAVAAASRGTVNPKLGQPLGYQTGKTAAQIKREGELKGHLKDPTRNIVAPLIVLLVGLGLYIGNLAYVTHGNAVAAISIGVTIITFIQAVLLIVFALVIAGPLGVSFGHPGTAALKLAAIAALSDGITAWIGMWIASAAAGMSYPITIPISTAIYWIGLIQLFNMDGGDSWLVVTILSIVDRLLLGIILLILGSVLLGSAGSSPISIGSSASGTTFTSERAQDVDAIKENKQWVEARKYIADGGQLSLKQTVEDMYAAGAKQIGFDVPRDFSGHGSAATLYIELPAKKEARAKIIQLRADWLKSIGMSVDAEDLQDDPEENWIMIGVR